jgi:dihydropyrimidine dehydrogenase (NAD+) subunit PreA
MRHFSEVARAVKVPLSAVGGVTGWQEVVEYIMLGASCVQTATAIMWNGLGQVAEILQGLSDFMDRRGYRSIEDFRGIALPYITTVEELAKEAPKFAAIDQELCRDCDICAKVCFYGAIRKVDGQVKADRSACDGCGLCAQWCPAGAITLKE